MSGEDRVFTTGGNGRGIESLRQQNKKSSVVDKICVRNVKCDYKGVPQIPTVITRLSDL
jgi:hypothetical protein